MRYLLLLVAAVASAATTPLTGTYHDSTGANANGIAYVTNPRFITALGVNVAARTLTFQIVNGVLSTCNPTCVAGISLEPSDTSTPVFQYQVRYSFTDGQVVEAWAVPTSASPIDVHSIATVGPAPAVGSILSESQITSLVSDLANRIIKGAGYANSKAAIINSSGQIDGASGTSSWCVHVDGTSAICGAGVTDHSLLTNLSYAASGHTGFQASGNYIVDPGSNGIMKRTGLNTSAIAVNTDIVSAFTGTPTGSKFLRDDGTLAVPPGGTFLSDPGANGPIKRTSLNTTAAAINTDIVGLFTGTPTGSKFLRDDGTLAVPPGGTYLGDPGSNGVMKRTALNTTAPAVLSDIMAFYTGTPTGSKFVRDDGVLAVPPGGGGGATQSSALTDWNGVRTSGTVITFGSPCAPSTPCPVNVGGTAYQFTGGPYTLTMANAHTGKVCVYVSNAGTLSVAIGGASLVTGDITASAGVTPVSLTGGNCPTDSTKLLQWTATTGAYDSAVASFQLASYLSYKPSPAAGRGISVTPGATDTIASTAAITTTCVGTPGNTAGNYGDFCIDAGNIVYACKNGANCTVSTDWVSTGGGGGGGSVTFSPPYLISGGLNYGPIMGPFTPIIDANFSWVNQGGATLSYYNGAAFLTAPAVAGNNLRLRVMNAPATPYSITMAIVPQLSNVNYNTCGLVTYESGTGKAVTFQYLQGNSMGVDHYASTTTFTSNPILMNINAAAAPVIFMKVRNDGANMTYSYSTNNGNDFLTVGSEAISAGFTTAADKVGFFCDANNSTFTAAQLILGWKQGT